MSRSLEISSPRGMEHGRGVLHVPPVHHAVHVLSKEPLHDTRCTRDVRTRWFIYLLPRPKRPANSWALALQHARSQSPDDHVQANSITIPPTMTCFRGTLGLVVVCTCILLTQMRKTVASLSKNWKKDKELRKYWQTQARDNIKKYAAAKEATDLIATPAPLPARYSVWEYHLTVLQAMEPVPRAVKRARWFGRMIDQGLLPKGVKRL